MLNVFTLKSFVQSGAVLNKSEVLCTVFAVTMNKIDGFFWNNEEPYCIGLILSLVNIPFRLE